MFVQLMEFVSKYALPFVIFTIPVYAIFKKVKVYQVFVEGAREGLTVAVTIVPFLVCMLCAIGMFRASGAMSWLVAILSPFTNLIDMPAEILPMGIMRSFSGGGAEGILTDLLTAHGADSQIGRMASVAMGSTETTFYVLAVYFGSIGVTKVRHAVVAGLLGDLASLLAACFLTNTLWG
ncbi:MAG: spore maturation protein [Synergistaceae bacterium]|jgi:spore maturation protein B|nr:spore maturation protein [Synergistaceae bacterium]